MLLAYVGYVVVTEDYRKQAAEIDISERYINDVEQPSFILDRNGDEFGRLFVENRHSITIEEVPQKFINALTAGEDSRFFTHDGVDYIGLVRATILNLKSGAEDSGASTLTMQLARNAFDLKALTEGKGQSKYERKVVEIFLSKRIEEKYTKSQIMEYYINRVPFGRGFYGIRSAALGYFGKEPKDLEVHECASLVGCIKNPSVFNPLRNPENNKTARDHVLNRMRIEGMLTDKECEDFQNRPVEVDPKPLRRGTSHFYDRVAEFVGELNLPEEKTSRGGLRIFTTVDKKLQQNLNKRLRQQLDEIEARDDYTDKDRYKDYVHKKGSKPNYLQGAAIAVNHKSGEVLAYVGGRDHRHSQYDFVEEGQRPLGTAFLPFVYLASLENGGNFGSTVIDEAMDNRMVMVDGIEGILAEWGMEVNDPRYEGRIPARRALEASKIAATVRLGKAIGLDKVAQTAKRFGLKMPYTRSGRRVLPRGLMGSENSTVSDLVKAYGAIANKGKMIDDFVWVTRVETADGELLYERPGMVGTKTVMDRDQAYLMHTGLEGVLKNGNAKEKFNRSGLSDFHGGVKTGTTYDFADNWAVGYNSEVTCAIWTGIVHGKRKEIYPGAFAKDTALPVWLDFMKQANKRFNGSAFEQPDSIQSELICRHSGLRCTGECFEYKRNHRTGKSSFISTGYTEYFRKENVPSGFCDYHGGGGTIADLNVDSGSIGKELLFAIPIRPVEPTLLGDDPYDTELPSFAPRDSLALSRRQRATGVKLDQLDLMDEEAELVQAPPGRLHIDE